MDGNGFPSAPLRGPGGSVPITIPLTALRPVLSSSSSSTSPVTLTAPRPETERRDNDYVETPIRNALPPPPPLPAVPRPPPPPVPAQQQQGTALEPIISKQPMAAGKAGTAAETGGAELCDTLRPSILCTTCGRCKCETCRAPKPLPECWLCNDGCLLSADSVVDYGSCLCCVKTLFYHCSEEDDVDNQCVDDPCGCAPDRRAARWGCLATLVCALPCLVLYWPLRGAKRAVELCYERHSRAGCRCRPPKQSQKPPAKRLLGNDSLQDF